jgi:hypothetical protein
MQSLSNPSPLAKFPANREKNREFCRIGSPGAVLNAFTPRNSEAFGIIPYATEQGNILAKQGILSPEQGILATKSESNIR